MAYLFVPSGCRCADAPLDTDLMKLTNPPRIFAAPGALVSPGAAPLVVTSPLLYTRLALTAFRTHAVPSARADRLLFVLD